MKRALVADDKVTGRELPGAVKSAVSVLIIDDNSGSLELLSKALAQPGFEILTASNPEEGLETSFATGARRLCSPIW